jgi:hypothetical protein
MVADAKRWGWAFCIAAVTPEGEVVLLDPALASKRNEVRVDDVARIDNLLIWLER